MNRSRGFTLIELLIVVAIIAILAAIAVPNFLEAQTRAKVSRAMADMRSIDTGMQSYIVDNNVEPVIEFPFDDPNAGKVEWWGFVSHQLTTPVSYLSSLPVMPFVDTAVAGFWKAIDAKNGYPNQPYTMVRDTSSYATLKAGTVRPAKDIGGIYGRRILLPEVVIGDDWIKQAQHAGYIIYTSGPDNIDSTVWGYQAIYDPSNGTVSFGDIYRFGAGENKKD